MDEVRDPAAGSLLRSKLQPPQVPADYMPRPHVQAALAANPHARLIVLSAPAGFGKSTALAAMAQAYASAGNAVAWFSLSPEDDDPSRFFQQLIEALRVAIPGLGDDALSYLQNTMRVPAAALMESLLADLAQREQPLLLVLDDLHLVQDSELLASLNRLVKLAPAGFVLAIGSRSTPTLNLATWRAKEVLLELGASELRMSKDETREDLDRGGLHLDEVALNALHGHTEGWVVGVHLASLWLRHQPQASKQMAEMGGDQVAVGDYLLRSVFEQLSAEMQD
ncbi:MAG: AAA family ATPase, partial [Pseudomonas sp.]